MGTFVCSKCHAVIRGAHDTIRLCESCACAKIEALQKQNDTNQIEAAKAYTALRLLTKAEETIGMLQPNINFLQHLLEIF